MKIGSYEIEFESSGRTMSGFTCGVVGLDPDTLHVCGGFDNGQGGPEEFTAEERRELAEHMMKAWAAFAEGE